jgi:hypothetical protein
VVVIRVALDESLSQVDKLGPMLADMGRQQLHWSCLLLLLPSLLPARFSRSD